MHEGPLDMRMNRESKLDACYVVNQYSEEQLADIIHRYGEERWSKRIAQFIVNERKIKPIVTTGELVTVIKKQFPKELGRMDRIRQNVLSRQSELKLITS